LTQVNFRFLIGELDYIYGGTKMSIIQNARRSFLDIMVENLKAGDGWYTEDDSDLNNATRCVIQAMHDHYGDCWLGLINVYDKSKPAIWKYDLYAFLCNFSADFAIPKYDKILHDLILERDNTPYISVTDDKKLIDSIFDRIKEIDGYILTWV
jgi:hypothetical protein